MEPSSLSRPLTLQLRRSVHSTRFLRFSISRSQRWSPECLLTWKCHTVLSCGSSLKTFTRKFRGKPCRLTSIVGCLPHSRSVRQTYSLPLNSSRPRGDRQIKSGHWLGCEWGGQSTMALPVLAIAWVPGCRGSWNLNNLTSELASDWWIWSFLLRKKWWHFRYEQQHH